MDTGYARNGAMKANYTDTAIMRLRRAMKPDYPLRAIDVLPWKFVAVVSNEGARPVQGEIFYHLDHSTGANFRRQ